MKNDLSVEAQALLQGAKGAGGPSLERRARLTASVMAATGGGPGPGSAAGGPALKLFGGWVLAGLVAVWGLTWAFSPEVAASAPPLSAAQPAPPAPAPAEPPISVPGAPEVPAPEVPAPVAAPLPVRAPRLSRVAAVAPVVAPVAVEVRAEEEPDELTSLGLSLEALDQGRAQDALSLARSARARFPQGVVRPELTLAEVLAWCALGQHAQASAVAGAMPAVDQTSLVSEKLRRSCVGPLP